MLEEPPSGSVMNEGGSESGCEQGSHAFPKRECAIDPIDPCGKLAMLALCQGKNRASSAQFSPV